MLKVGNKLILRVIHCMIDIKNNINYIFGDLETSLETQSCSQSVQNIS